MKKRCIRFLIPMVFILLFGVAVYSSSKDNLSNIENDRENKMFYENDIMMMNWSDQGGIYISGDDSQIVVPGVDCYVHTVTLKGVINPTNDKIDVFYTTLKEENFSEDKSLSIPYSVRGNSVILTVDTMASALRLDVYDIAGSEIKIENIEINDRSLVFGINSIAKICIVPTMLVGIILTAAMNLGSLSLYFSTFKRFIPLLKNLISRDLKVKYRRSALGFLWSILNPLLMALVLNIVFAKLFRFQVEYFATYYLIGALIFNFVVECTTGSMMSVIGAAPLIKKVYIPKYIFPLQKCVFAFINMLFGSVAVVVVMLIQGVTFHWTIILFFVPMLYAFVFAYGFGLMLAAFTVFFRDIEHLYSVWCTIWMYLTPIIYPEDLLVSNGLSVIMKLNPMYYFVHSLRNIVMYGTLPTLSDNIVSMAFSLIFIVMGLYVFKKMQDRFILYI